MKTATRSSRSSLPGHAARVRANMIRTPAVIVVWSVCLAVVSGGAGCSSPNPANIKLRRDNQELADKVATLERQHAADIAQIRALESHATTVPVLPQERVETLFTAHGLKFGRLTGGADLDPNKPGDEAIKVYVVPIDGEGQQIKAAGSFSVDAFDLGKSHADRRIGHWEFPLDQAAKKWFGQAMLYTYVLTCPWQGTPPADAELTIRVTFTDALTQRQFTEQKQVKINPPPATQPVARQ